MILNVHEFKCKSLHIAGRFKIIIFPYWGIIYLLTFGCTTDCSGSKKESFDNLSFCMAVVFSASVWERASILDGSASLIFTETGAKYPAGGSKCIYAYCSKILAWFGRCLLLSWNLLIKRVESCISYFPFAWLHFLYLFTVWTSCFAVTILGMAVRVVRKKFWDGFCKCKCISYGDTSIAHWRFDRI